MGAASPGILKERRASAGGKPEAKQRPIRSGEIRLWIFWIILNACRSCSETGEDPVKSGTATVQPICGCLIVEYPSRVSCPDSDAWGSFRSHVLQQFMMFHVQVFIIFHWSISSPCGIGAHGYVPKVSKNCQPFSTIPTDVPWCSVVWLLYDFCMTCLSLWRWRTTCRTVMFWFHTRPYKMVAMWSWGSWDVVVKESCTWGRRHLDETWYSDTFWRLRHMCIYIYT